jgi:hypothetical protein
MISWELLVVIGAVAAAIGLPIYLQRYRQRWNAWRARHPEPPDVHLQRGPRFRPVAVELTLDRLEFASSGWGISVTDRGLLLRRPLLAARQPGLWIPWSAVEAVEPKSSVFGKRPGQALSWVEITLRDSQGTLCLDDPAGEAAHGQWRVFRAHAGPTTA